jgi:diacylglycerol kinase family enzyme
VDASGRRGFATYARITARELLRYPCGSYRVGTTENGPLIFSGRALLVTVANSPQWGNGARIAPRARVDDGLLDLVVFAERSRVRTICALPRVFTGAMERVAGFSTMQIAAARIESDQPLIFHVDGEPVRGGNVLDVRVRPAALRIAAR